MTPADPDLTRFVEAQQDSEKTALAELRAGRKQTHWMWFIFPQLAGLGHSAAAQFYGIQGLAEAIAYLNHPVLGPRLEACCEALLQVQSKTAHEIFGTPDDLKLRSSMTLFQAAAGNSSIFTRVLDLYYAGEPDHRTLDLLSHP